MRTLRDALQNQVSNPGHAPYQQQVGSTLQGLRAALAAARSNSLSPAWELAAREMGAYELMGSRLMTKLDEIFARNQITPTIAHQEVAQLLRELELLESALSNFVSSCGALHVDPETLRPGESELGVLLPREFFSNSLDGFARELERLNRNLGPFAELSTGSRPGYEIRSLSSSDLSVFLEMAPKVAACVAVAVERIVALYKQLLEIRALRDRLSGQGLPQAALQGVDSHANGVMTLGIDALVTELLNKYAPGKEAGRINELRVELTSALKSIANRVDRGVRIEIRVEPLRTGDEAGDEAGGPDAEDVQIALAASKQIEFLRPAGEPILSLPEPTEPASGGQPAA
jgi:hypothetical protein